MIGDHNMDQKHTPRGGQSGGQPTLGEYLRGLRLCQNEMSLDKMAEKVGCAKSYLWDVENDNVMPTLAKAAVMAKAYKTSLNQMGRYL
jgi:transcriptional regulator with XRE-family HTH domain